ncbi:glycerophosphoryl diester phosphodiesterase,putative [Leishmania mexicana MHOM/GT/2001/U1103]|uniref:Glycerophosphoryl diester phosphodiesterase,putative n=1 Tax=Leishmania mexicana (strain MHOM/GT/2001/U1103) TaxID=929439 RepID=E9B031_LEIMU|nr:glycerophosphoryl diester phosphodiesterase,putative [Leishmania mexicana MHOM/GT/2001/U1103]CBZ28582.1 glycerophosphoryl diester phosphodiesterase,putative [Leishmania mexicana MHOM/GT/2001/U1103]
MRLLSTVVLSAGAYIAASICLLQMAIRSKRRKLLLKRNFPYPITKIAHRGGSLLGPENTMYAFMQAAEVGLCDMIELDVVESKDGQIVVCHDRTLERTCGPEYAGVAISDLVVGKNPSKTLPQCKRTIELEFATRGIKQYEGPDSVPVDDTTRICLLSEVFKMFPSMPLHIDIKDESKDFVAVVLNLLAAHGREGITIVGSSRPKNRQFINEYFAERDPEIRKRYRIFGGPHDFFRTYLLFYTGLLPYFPVNYDVFSIPVFTSTMKKDAERKYGRIVAAVAAFLFSSPLLWRYLQSRGVAVIGWNLNDGVDILQGIQWPLNGLMSDDPIKLRQVINANKKVARLNVLVS